MTGATSGIDPLLVKVAAVRASDMCATDPGPVFGLRVSPWTTAAAIW